MIQYLLYLAPPALLAVVVVLGLGLVSFASEGEKARRRSNKLMQWRIILQLAAVVLILAIVLLARAA